jgi:hypothetical protein
MRFENELGLGARLEGVYGVDVVCAGDLHETGNAPVPERG